MSEPKTINLESVEIADTSSTRSAGLMFRDEPSPLMIVFGFQARHPIWMLFMRFPIDLIFLDSEKRVVTIHENIKPLSLDPRTWKIYWPERPVKYAFEAEAGWAQKHSVAPGDLLSFEY